MILFFSSLFRLYCILSTYIVPVLTLVLYSMILFWRTLYRLYSISMVPDHSLFYLMASSLEESVHVIYDLYSAIAHLGLLLYDPLLLEQPVSRLYIISMMACAHLSPVLNDPLLEEPVCSGYILSWWCLCAHLGLLLDALFSGGACLVRSYIISMVPMLTLVLYLMASSLEELVWSGHILSLWCPCSPWSFTWCPLLWRSLSGQIIYYLYGAHAHLGLVLDGLFWRSLFRLYIISIVPVLTLVLYLMILFWRSHSLQVIYDLDDGLCSL
jgi:hypothetical protein